MWPLDGWHVAAVVGLRRLADMRIVPWLRARLLSCPEWTRMHRRRLAAGVVMGAIAGAALMLPHFGVPHPGAGSTPARAVAATQAPATPASPLPATSAPALPIAAAAPASTSTVSSAVRPVQS